MFSDHLKKVDEVPYKLLLGIAGGVVIVCQLLALALVTDEQVKKAQTREVLLASERVAVADCIERNRGVTRHSCIQQARGFSDPAQAVAQMPEIHIQHAGGSIHEIASALAPKNHADALVPVTYATGPDPAVKR